MPFGSQYVAIYRVVSLAMMSVALVACVTDEKTPATISEIASDNRISGSVGNGPIVGAAMRVFQNGGNELAQFQSDANASYGITVNTESQFYPLFVDATGGTDLVTTLTPDFDLRSAVFERSEQTVANVNPFSTIVVSLAQDLPGGATRDNLQDAQATVSAQLNSGLQGLAASGPVTTQIDETNIAEIIKASVTLAEAIRRTRDLLIGAGYLTTGDIVVTSLASDLADEVVDGRGGPATDARTAAVMTLVYGQVLMEAMANELYVNGSDASIVMNQAVGQVVVGTPTSMIEDQTTTFAMIGKSRVGLAAAFALDGDLNIFDLHGAVSGLRAGMDPLIVRAILPADYRTTLQNSLLTIASADDSVIDMINGIARTNGDIDSANNAPTIAGTPVGSVVTGSSYSFTPTASDPEGDALTFSISNTPAWASFDAATGTLSGTPSAGDVGSYANIVISVSDGSLSDDLPPFTISVTAANAAPSISGSPPTSVVVGQTYSFTPTASDPEGDALTFSISNTPAWASFDAATGTLSGTPSAGDVGSYANISINVSDGILSDTLGPFSIDVQAISTGSVTLSWTPPTENDDGTTLVDLAGYKVYWGTSSGTYPNSVTIANPSVTTFVVENLGPGTYEFVATAFNTSGVESTFSNTATKIVP